MNVLNLKAADIGKRSMKNRKIILNTNLYDFLMSLDVDCRYALITRTEKYSINRMQRCKKFNSECDKCIASWLNEDEHDNTIIK